MSNFLLYSDVLMSAFWCITYLLVLISTCKSGVPAMAPIACAFIFPWEFSAAIGTLIGGGTFSYVWLAHVGFCILDLSIILYVLFKLRYYNKLKTILYVLLVIAITVFLWFAFEVPDGMMYTSYINTLIGILFWVVYIRRPEYPLTKLNLTIAILKFVADCLAFITYHNYSDIIFVISLFLPAVEVLHIFVLLHAMRVRRA